MAELKSVLTTLARHLARAPTLAAAQAARLDAWRALPAPPMERPVDESRYVVVDVESSGLNVARDRLLAIGAVAIVAGKIRLGDSLELVLQQDRVSKKDNILIHGIGGTAQREGMPPAEALLRFLEYAGKDPLLAFHVAFDEGMIRRAARRFLGLELKAAWLDMAYLAPALYPRVPRSQRSLDHWMARFGIVNYARHGALADAVATAELFLALRPRMREEAADNLRELRALAIAQYKANWAM